MAPHTVFQLIMAAAHSSYLTTSLSSAIPSCCTKRSTSAELRAKRSPRSSSRTLARLACPVPLPANQCDIECLYASMCCCAMPEATMKRRSRHAIDHITVDG